MLLTDFVPVDRQNGYSPSNYSSRMARILTVRNRDLIPRLLNQLEMIRYVIQRSFKQKRDILAVFGG